MTWVTRFMNGTMPVVGSQRPNTFALVDVVGGQIGQGSAAAVVVVDPHRPGLPGARVGWQRQRAWMEVFSSALMTYSSSPSGSPSQVRAYRSSTRAALSRKSGVA